jgi:hypothetical protein
LTTPITDGLLTVPYVGLLEFQASPTWLDLQDLVQGGDETQQNAEIYNQLLKASAWADNFCSQPLRAHTATEQGRARVDRRGRMWLHPHNNPVRSITGLAYGTDLEDMTIVSDFSQAWVEDQRGIIIALTSYTGSWAGSLQFGSVPTSGSECYVQYQYVAGYGNAVLTSNTNSGVIDLPVDNPAGFLPASTTLFGTAFGASVARIWEPAAEEAISISSGYNVGTSPLMLSSATLNAHTAGVQISEFPPEIRQAVTQYACGLMLREDTSNDMPFPGSPGPTARQSETRGVAGGLISEAERMLMPYRRVR